MTSPSSSSRAPQLTAIYRSSNGTKEFKRSVQEPTTSSDLVTSKEEKTAYLSALRSSVTALQDEVNVYLTQKMEEDKAAEKGGDTGRSQENGVIDEAKEEELYGEELAEEGA